LFENVVDPIALQELPNSVVKRLVCRRDTEIVNDSREKRRRAGLWMSGNPDQLVIVQPFALPGEECTQDIRSLHGPTVVNHDRGLCPARKHFRRETVSN
jgi:hypothetical protein